jgi:hypothetical protein
MQQLQQHADRLISFDIVSLFTEVFLKDTSSSHLSNMLESKAVHLFRQVLISAYFLFDGKYRDNAEETATRSSLAPAVTKHKRNILN